MTTNVEILARNSYLDGVALRFVANDAVLSQGRYNGIISALAEASGWEDAAVRDYVKFQKIPSGKHKGTSLDAFFIGGKLARYFNRAGLTRYIRNVTEIHAKFHLIEREPGSHDKFIDALYYRPGRYAGTVYLASKSKRNKRESGTKGFTVGSQKSDLHVTINRYANERTGVEGHVKRKMLSRIKDDERRRNERAVIGRDEEFLFLQVFSEAATRSALRFLRAVRSRGIVLTDYFIAASYVSWKEPLHEKGVDLLSEQEEHDWVQLGEQGDVRLFDRHDSIESEAEQGELGI